MKGGGEMNAFFSFERAGGVSMYSQTHLLWLASAAAFALWCALCARRKPELCRALGLVLLCAELTRVCVIYCCGQLDHGFLPLHLCGVAVYACALHAARGGELLGELIYSSFAPGALAALLFPDWLAYPPTSFLFLSSFGIHMLICGYACAMLASGAHTPDARRLPRCFAVLLIYAFAVWCIDRLLRVNYLFLLHPAAGSPLEWFEEVLPWYALGYLPMVAIVWVALYAPLYLRRISPRANRTASRRTHRTEHPAAAAQAQPRPLPRWRRRR
jgi:uncharacterized membrane protein YwaF